MSTANNEIKLENVDEVYKNKSSNDFTLNSQNITTTVASISTREIQEIDSIANDHFMKVAIPDEYRIDAKPFIERPFYVGEVTFSDTAGRNTLLTNTIRFLPGDVARSNASLMNMFKMGAYGRPDLVLSISMAGTITHAGCVLVGVLPPLPSYPTSGNRVKLLNTILTGPHAFLHANEATSVALTVPWYCNTDMATLDMEQTTGYDTSLDIIRANGNYATLVFYVLNPLRPSTGSSTSLKIVIEACFKHFDMVVPTPRFVTWTTQSGKRPPQITHMLNPVYEEFEKLKVLMDGYEWSKPKEKKDIDYRKILAIAASGITIGLGIVRVVAMCTTGDVDGEQLDDIRRVVENVSDMQPQSALLDIGKNFMTGLFDNATSGLKKVTGDAIDYGRGIVRDYTGLHNPNVPLNLTRTLITPANYLNVTDGPQFFEKLDPLTKFDRVVKEPIFGTTVDEMAITHITSKKQLIGTIAVRAGDTVGTRLWARPISPFQGGLVRNTVDHSVTCTNNLELMHAMHRAWRGDLRITIQSVMNNKQQCKLKLLKMYNPSIKALSAYPAYQSISNAPSHLMEFTQGGQEQEIVLPYLCRNDMTPCAENMDTEAMFHGMYYIYLAQPLATSDGSPTDIEFNIYMSGEPNLTFYGYTKSNTYHESYELYNTVIQEKPSVPVHVFCGMTNVPEVDRPYPAKSEEHFKKLVGKYEKNRDPKLHPTSVASPTEKDDKKLAELWTVMYNTNLMLIDELDINGYTPEYWDRLSDYKIDGSGRVAKYNKYPKISWLPQSGTIEVMNQPQKQSNEIARQDKSENLGHLTRLMPNLDIRPLIRRMYKTETRVVDIHPDATLNVSLPLNGYVGENSWSWSYTPIETLSRMYYGKTTGFKIRMTFDLNRNNEAITDIQSLVARAYYVPQNVGIVSTSKTITSAIPNVSSFVPPNLTSTSGEIPFPLQIVRQNNTLTSCVLEFVVPDTCFYKFMGGPDKFNNFDGSGTLPVLSIADFGSVVIQITNNDHDKPARLHYETFVGLTDESRFGFHAMAPPFKIYKGDAYYMGTDTMVNDPVSEQLNPFVYYGGIII